MTAFRQDSDLWIVRVAASFRVATFEVKEVIHADRALRRHDFDARDLREVPERVGFGL